MTIRKPETNSEIRAWLHDRKLNYCFYCGQPLSSGGRFLPKLSLDHFVAKSLGGKDGITNLVPSCVPCNQEKDNGSAIKTNYSGLNLKARRKKRDMIRARRHRLFWAIYKELGDQHEADTKVRS